MDTGELAARPDPRRLEADLRRSSRRLVTVGVLALVAIAAAAVFTLVYTVRTLHVVEAATSPEAQARSNARIAAALATITCDRRDDLEAAVATVLAGLSDDGSAPRVSIEWPAEPPC